MSALEPGRVIAHDIGRQFQLTGGGRSIRATLLRYPQGDHHEFWAVRHVSLDIQPGETFGIVGRNGSGKSTLLKMIAQIFGPSEGWCEYGGRISSLLELGAGFHPEFSAVENIFLSAAIYGIPRKEIERDVDSIIAFAELEQFAHQPVKTFSSGMFARLGFSVAMHVRPDVLLLDEVLAVGDEPFVQKCFGRIAEYKRDGGTMVLVTHNPGAVEQLCDRATILEHGEQVFLGSGADAVVAYHERIADEETKPDEAGLTHDDTSGLDVEVHVRHADGRASDRFMESEPIAIDAVITSPQDIPSAQVTIGMREASGFGFGNRTHHVDLTAGVPTTVRLLLPEPPMRDGRFSVGIRIRSRDGDRTLALLEQMAHFSVFSRTPNAEGAILLQGEWSVRA